MATQIKNIILLVIMVLGSVSICYATKYEYDSLNRLSKATLADGTRIIYSYDASGNRSEKVVALRVDLNIDGSVGFPDLATLAAQWLQSPGEPSADVAPWPDLDETVDFKDFAALADFWLGGLGNHAPILASIGDKSVNVDTLLAFVVVAIDEDNDLITYYTYNLPSGATFCGQVFIWTPSETQVGTYEVTFGASDGQDEDSETISITVARILREPRLSINRI